MKRSNRLILLIGLVLAVAAFVGIFMVLSNGSGLQAPAVVTGKFVTAAVDIPIGTTITAEMLAEKEVPKTDVPLDSFPLKEAVVGKIVRTEVKTGAYVSQTTFSDLASQDALSSLLPAGYRAIAIRVDQVNGIGTLVRPGDFVDVIVTFGAGKFPVVRSNEDTGKLEVASDVNATSVKDIIQNVQVVATLDAAAAAAAAAAPANGVPVAPTGAVADDADYQVVILAVTAQQAEVLRFSEVEGFNSTVTLILRSAADKDAPPDDTTGITLRQLVDRWAVLPPQIVETVLPD